MGGRRVKPGQEMSCFRLGQSACECSGRKSRPVVKTVRSLSFSPKTREHLFTHEIVILSLVLVYLPLYPRERSLKVNVDSA